MRVEPHVVTVPEWRRRPATLNPPTGVKDFIARSNEYFSSCVDNQTRPTLTGYALAVGMPGPTSLLRLGQRLPELRYALSRCMMAVAVEYEEMIGSVNAAGPMFMLKNIPDFDPDEPVGAPAVQFFNDRKEIVLTNEVYGAARSDKQHDNEDPLETYIRLIRQRGYLPGEESESVVLKGTKPSRRALTIITEGWEDE